MCTIYKTRHERLVRRGKSPPQPGDEDILELLPDDSWISLEQLRDEVAARELVRISNPAWALPFDDSAVLWPWVCRTVAKQRLEQAIASRLLTERVVIHVEAVERRPLVSRLVERIRRVVVPA